MHRGSIGRLWGLALAVILAAAGPAGCGSEGGSPDIPFPTDSGNPLDGTTTDNGELGAPVCTITAPGESLIMSEIIPDSKVVKVTATDPGGKGIVRVVLAFQVDGVVVKVGDLTDIPSDGKISTTIDTSGVKDGPRLFVCQAETADGRKGATGVSVHVDNDPPVIQMLVGTTSGIFLNDLVIIFIVSDGLGVGTNTVDITVNGTAQVGPPAPVQEGVPHTVTIAAEDLVNGEYTIELTATDKVPPSGNKMPEPYTYTAIFTAAPRFHGGISGTLPEGFPAEVIAGLVFDGNWTVAAAGKQGLRIFTLGAGDQLKEVLNVVDTTISKVRAGDMNADGLDDLVTVGTEVKETGTVTVAKIHLQTKTAEAAGFEQAWAETLDSDVNDLALGFLNDDAYLDLALALDSDTSSVGMVLSKGTEEAAWDTPKLYGGVQSPHLIGIGEFTNHPEGEPPQNDILVARPNTSIVTVYPLNKETGTPSAGINSALGLGQENPYQSLSTLVTGNWSSNLKGSMAVFTDSKRKSWLTAAGDGSGKIADLSHLGTGNEPSRMIVGDIDRDDNEDLALLCPGSHMVMFFWGKAATVGDAFTEGNVTLLVGASTTDITLADLVGDDPADPYLDLVALEGDRLTVIPFDESALSEGRKFKGPILIRLDVEPIDMVAGKFAHKDQLLEGFKDLAILAKDDAGKPRVFFRLADFEQGLPTMAPGNSLEPFITDPVGLIAANLDNDDDGFDDLLIPTNSSSPPGTVPPIPTIGRILLADSESHGIIKKMDFIDPTTGLLVGQGFYGGNSPQVMVVEDLDRNASKPDVKDLAVIAEFDTDITENVNMERLFQPFIGEEDGTFVKKGNVYYPIPESKEPVALFAAKLNNTTLKQNHDVIMASSTTDDITIFFASGLALFAASPGEAEDLAVGPSPQDVAAAYMKDPFEVRPDIVTLLESDVALMYSTYPPNPGSDDPVMYEPTAYLGHTGSTPSGMALEDINGDGYQDIILVSRQASNVAIYLNLANRQYSSPYVFDTGNEPIKLVVEDLDNDSCMDVATVDKKGGTITLLNNLLCSD